MSDDKTRVLPRKAASQPTEGGAVQIVFFCPAGHRIAVAAELAGKRGKCSKCSAPVEIPNRTAEEPSPTAEISVASSTASGTATNAAVAADAGADDGDWNFISGIDSPGLLPPSDVSSDWAVAQAIPPDANPMARLLARLWAERDHGGIVELHLVGGAVILPEEFAPHWSVASHGVFASQAADGSVTITAVAWETVQRIVVRQLAAVPGDMFE